MQYCSFQCFLSKTFDVDMKLYLVSIQKEYFVRKSKRDALVVYWNVKSHLQRFLNLLNKKMQITNYKSLAYNKSSKCYKAIDTFEFLRNIIDNQIVLNIKKSNTNFLALKRDKMQALRNQMELINLRFAADQQIEQIDNIPPADAADQQNDTFWRRMSQPQFSTCKQFVELLYFCFLIALSIYKQNITPFTIAWLIWIVLFGSCWKKTTCMEFMAKATNLGMISVGLYYWLFGEADLVILTFLIIYSDQIFKLMQLLQLSGACFVVLCKLCLYATYVNQRIKKQKKKQQQKRKQFLEKLSKQMYMDIDMNKQQIIGDIEREHINEKECSICLQSAGQKVKLDCEHQYHKGCLQIWLKTKNTCPMCRVELF